jgi:hypothetical protein
MALHLLAPRSPRFSSADARALQDREFFLAAAHRLRPDRYAERGRQELIASVALSCWRATSDAGRCMPSHASMLTFSPRWPACSAARCSPPVHSHHTQTDRQTCHPVEPPRRRQREGSGDQVRRATTRPQRVRRQQLVQPPAHLAQLLVSHADYSHPLALSRQ